MTLLTLVQNTADLIGIPRPTAVVSSTDQQVRQLYALANVEISDEVRGFPWRELITEYTFPATAAYVQAGAIPADWLSFVADSLWNRSLDQPIRGPVSPQAWQAMIASGTINPVPPAFRLRGADFLMTPIPTAGNTIAYEYISKNGVLSNALVPKEQFTADDDTARISEKIVSYGVRWRFKAAKGLDYAEDLVTYGRELALMQAKNKGLQTLSLSWPAYYDQLPSPWMKEGSWP